MTKLVHAKHLVNIPLVIEALTSGQYHFNFKQDDWNANIQLLKRIGNKIIWVKRKCVYCEIGYRCTGKKHSARFGSTDGKVVVVVNVAQAFYCVHCGVRMGTLSNYSALAITTNYKSHTGLNIPVKYCATRGTNCGTKHGRSHESEMAIGSSSFSLQLSSVAKDV